MSSSVLEGMLSLNLHGEIRKLVLNKWEITARFRRNVKLAQKEVPDFQIPRRLLNEDFPDNHRPSYATIVGK